MHWMSHPYSISLFSAAIISLALAASAWKTPTAIHTRSFAVLMLTVSLWAVMHIFELAAPTLTGKVFWANMQFFCIVSVPPVLLGFVVRYTRRECLITPPRVVFLVSIPLIILALVWTNDRHGWVFTEVEMLHVVPFELLYRHFGVGFWIHTGYCYFVMMIATILLVRSMAIAPGRYKGQVVSLLIGVFTPWIGNAMYIFKIAPFSQFDMTPVVFTFSGLAFAWGVFRHRLLDIVPVAYDLMLNKMQDAVFVVDRRNRVLDFNPAAAGLIGGNTDGNASLTAELLIPGWSDMILSMENGVMRQQVCLRHDNQERFYDLVGTALWHKDHLFGYLVVLRDITHFRHTQLALAESEKQFKSLSENAPIIICTLDLMGVFTYVNPEWEKVLGHPREQVVGRAFWEFVLPRHADDFTHAFHTVRDNLEVLSGLPMKLLHDDGSKRYFNASASPNLDAEGKITDVICLLKDQTGERKLQAQLFQSQKMEAIGTLAGGIAHDFNNLLMGIQANVSLIRMEDRRDSCMTKRIDSVERQIQTGASLTRQLLGYARKGKYRPGPMCLNQLVQDTLSAFGRTRKQLIVRFDPTDGLPHIIADRGQMELVLLNLLVNASDAMPEGGALIVKTGMSGLTPAKMESMALTAVSHVYLKITDTGIGMDEKTRTRIFEPFYTTKEIGRGTGLGLASVYGVVKNHDGAITVDSKPGVGTTFTVYLQAAENACPAATDMQPVLTGNGRILFVDDEPELLAAGTTLIEQLGYHVMRADNGFDAMRHLSENPNSFDLVIIDMIMPGMGGKELFGHMRRVSPKTRVLLSTGFSHTEDVSDILAHGRCDIISKPYTAELLSQKIKSMMHSHEKSSTPSCVETL